MRSMVFKRIMLATALVGAVAFAGVADKAHAFTFGQDDLVLAIYGNNTEALVNLGSYTTLLAGGASTVIDVSAELAASSVGDPTAVRYTVFGWDLAGLTTGLGVHAGTAANPSSIGGTIDLNNQFSISAAYTALPFSGNTIGKSNTESFFNNLNPDGTGTFNGSWTVAMQATVGQLLNILHGDAGDSTFALAGGALLGANGFLTIGNPGPAAVPLPAGVVLFGSGLIGLAGLARRSFNKTTA